MAPHIRMSLGIVWWVVAIALTAQADPAGSGARKIQRYALLVGVNDYSPPLGKLEYCHHDMSALRDHLEVAGFASEDITLMHDEAQMSRHRPSRSNIERELQLRLQLANPDDVVFVAFSGHGLHIDGKSYLCPSDAKWDATHSLISMDQVYAEMEKCQAKQKILIVDACRNETIIRGFKSGKLGDDVTVQVQLPPSGLLVLSSCESGQFSAEDSTLKHGVFMYFVMQGLRGGADNEDVFGGDRNGRISLTELYNYAHEKTKRHVAQSHGVVQRPVIKGEANGDFDLAFVPDLAKLKKLETSSGMALPKRTPSLVPPPSAGSAETVSEHPLLLQGDIYLRKADHENAIQAYSAIIENKDLDADVIRIARKSRGMAYLGRGSKSDLGKALLDQQAAGLPGIRVTIKTPFADLKVNSGIVGRVLQNQSVLISVINGDWLWVEEIDGSDKVQGYITPAAVIVPPVTPVATAKPAVTTSQPTTYPQGNSLQNGYLQNGYSQNGQGGFAQNGGYQQGGMRQNGYQQNGRYQGNNGGMQGNNGGFQGNNGGRQQGNSRPPSVWETPEWESPRQIREGRANGTLR